mgnify:CR=1 FL=1
MIKGVLFDFDGTLADSSKGIFATSTTVADAMGYTGPWSEKQLRKFVGPPLRECFKITFDMKEHELDEAVSRYRAIYNVTGYKECVLYPGIKELLIALRKQGLKVGVATNKGQDIAEKCINALGIAPLFDGIFGTDPVVKINKSACIKASCDAFALNPDEVLMIGDTDNDMLGAKEAGTEFLAVTWGFGFSLPWRLDEVDYVENALDVLDVLNKNGGYNMIEKIETKNAPAAIGPYSQAVKVGSFVFASGQIPVDPATGLVVEGTTADQARQCFKNIKAVLAEAGTDLTKVVKATVFLKDMNDFVPVNEVYAEAFSSSPVLPARSAVQVAKLPKDVGVEIEVIATL